MVSASAPPPPPPPPPPDESSPSSPQAARNDDPTASPPSAAPEPRRNRRRLSCRLVRIARRSISSSLMLPLSVLVLVLSGRMGGSRVRGLVVGDGRDADVF